MLRTRLSLTLLLAAVFVANFVETQAAHSLTPESAQVPDRAYQFASAMQRLEGYLSLDKFEGHGAAASVAIYACSVSYFFLFPALCLALMLSLALRPEIEAYRVFCLAVAFCYLFSVGFFILMPVPERWAVPDSGAVLLSDLWSSRLIASLRPISGLTNCFPSSHTSLTVIAILVSGIFRVRFFAATVALGVAIILSTFVLGIHWIPDVLAGGAVGWLSVSVARKVVYANP
jgi:membrane-associated phospholipid phosphatase